MKDLCGWIPFHRRTHEQNKANDAAIARMPNWSKVANQLLPASERPTRVNLYEYWSHPWIVKGLGYAFPGWLQYTGSCVGVGYGNVIATRAFIEIVKNREPERVILPFWPLTYGMSRLIAGMRGEGEGSMGGTIAEAAERVGNLSSDRSGLPKINYDGKSVSYSSAIEMKWSAGDHISQSDLAEAKNELVKNVVPLTSASMVRDCLINLQPVATAYDLYVGSARVQGSGENAALVGKYDSSGGHQTSFQAYWLNAQLGPLYYYMNQWPRNYYPQDPASGPLGGLWLPESEVEKSCRNGEVYAYFNLEGPNANEIESNYN